MIEPETGKPLLLYDAECGFCQRCVRFILRHERSGSLQFAALSGEVGGRMRLRFPELAGKDSLVWFEAHPDAGEPEPLIYSEALLAVMRYLGGTWRILGVLRMIPRPVRDFVYRLVARHRSALVGAEDRCAIPEARHRSRFLDIAN